MDEQNKIFQTDSSTIYAIDAHTIGKAIPPNSEKLINLEIEKLQFVNEICDFFPKFIEQYITPEGQRLIVMERIYPIIPKSYSKSELINMIEDLYHKIRFLHKMDLYTMELFRF
ncbi:MAG: hypothetical protein IPJ13_26520 [Saprospiraceae bacterium]|nr:hypothetical protein [Saprospiraceae bacterium]